jgi:DNA-binding transcriptional regulator YiaG
LINPKSVDSSPKKRFIGTQMLKKNIGTFKGFINEVGEKVVTFNNEPIDAQLELFNHSRVGLDWGYVGSGSLQLSFAILYRIAGEEDAKSFRTIFSKEVIALFDASWELSSKAVKKWLAIAKGELITEEGDHYSTVPVNSSLNVVKQACKELDITQKKLAEVLEVPEGTVSSWAVRNEFPRLAKKAIEFYIAKQNNEKIVKQFRDLIALVS